MRTDTPQTIYLKDYQPTPYKISHVDITFDIEAGRTTVTTKSQFTKNDDSNRDIILNGEQLRLVSVKLDGKDIDPEVTSKEMIISNPGKDIFQLEIVTEIVPEENTALEGLYNSGGTYCTQCEAEGFRKITYFYDRPDVMSTYRVQVIANKQNCPVLLSNGNLVEDGELPADRHYTIWDDPAPKPCYLFALVAGDLVHIKDTFTTMSGNNVDLYIYVREGDEGQCDHAMESLKKSMKWDEDVYGREYQYNRFNIVAVSDFNMGAMENTALNIFNTALVLAQQETATDTDFIRVESVIAHEYFHNWTGNRVTCRDWFQLSLKEGLTVFRDQEFSADLNSRAVQRIDDVTHLRRFQFPEDSSPLAHPVRPNNYIEINNFYTMTIYEKGAEVIRMFYTLLGPEKYREATDLYFDRHDGQAVTCDDWAKAMEDTLGEDLTQFKLWYSQAGTPTVQVQTKYDEDTKEFSLTLSQDLKPTPGQDKKEPMHIPVAVGLLDQTGHDLIGTEILHLKEKEQSFSFKNIDTKPTASILRNFSAPVRLETDLTNDDYKFLMVHDSDGFNRWEAGQTYYLNTINHIIDSESDKAPEEFLKVFGRLLEQAEDPNQDRALLSRALTLPDISIIGQGHDVVDPDKIHHAREVLKASIKNQFKDQLQKVYELCAGCESFSITPQSMGRRSLRSTMLNYLTTTNGSNCADLAKQHYDTANNMTDRMAALSAIVSNTHPERNEVIEDFYDCFKDYLLVIDKWFAVQAMAIRDDSFEQLEILKSHEDFNIKNPNRVRSLYAAFGMNNPVKFHDTSGKGYVFLKEAIIELNEINPQIAARMVTPLREWQRYTSDRQEMMKQALDSILKTPNLSPNVYELVSKSLKGA
ncbi:MAG: aminopeptidase N [Pseudomonadota bacterium]